MSESLPTADGRLAPPSCRASWARSGARAAWLAGLFGLVAWSGCGDSGAPSATAGYVYPEPDWRVEAPEDHGFSSAGLQHMADVAQGLGSDCLVVTQAGVIIGEWYWNGYGADVDVQDVFSVTKSIASALVGIAVGQGLLDIDAPVGFPEWLGTDSQAITPRDLLSNSSGRDLDSSINAAFKSAPDETQYAIDLGQAHPIGTYWEYNSPAVQTLERVLENAVGQDVGAFAEQALFSRIHMTVKLGHDGAGHIQTWSGASASCRDLARFGYLYLRGGRWANGEHIVPASWVAASIEPSTTLNSIYGLLWWLNRPGHWVLPPGGPQVPRQEGDGQFAPEAPADRYSASGAYGQFIVVEPASETVWVRLGITASDPLGTTTLSQLWDALAAAQLP